MGIIIPAAALFYREFVRFTDELALPFQSYLQIVPTSFFYFLKSTEVRFNFTFIRTHLRCALSTANLFDHFVDILWFDKSCSPSKRIRLIFTNRTFFRVNFYKYLKTDHFGNVDL